MSSKWAVVVKERVGFSLHLNCFYHYVHMMMIPGHSFQLEYVPTYVVVAVVGTIVSTWNL